MGVAPWGAAPVRLDSGFESDRESAVDYSILTIFP